MKKNKITVVQMLPDLNTGGVERGTLELGCFLRKRGNRSIVISGGGRLVKQLEKEGSSHINWAVGKKSLSTLKYILPLRSLLMREKVDILHLRSRVPAWVGYLAWKSLPRNKRPVLITTFHGFYSVHKFSAIMTKGQKIIAISGVIARHIKQEYNIPDERIVTIPRGVDIEKFTPEAVSNERIAILQEKWGIAGDSSPVIMLPGRITPLKGHDLFIRALSAIKDRKWTAIVIGDYDENPGHFANLIKLSKDLDIADRIKFTGHCDDMPAAYLVSDVVVSATTAKPEAFGRVAIEASAMARPVIATAHGGSMETVVPGKTGWLVPPADWESLSLAILEAVSGRDLRQKLGECGKQRVREKFSLTAMCESTLFLYYELLNEKTDNTANST